MPKTKGSGGRVTPSQKQQPGRYTPPIPREQRHSPGWYPYVIVTLFVLGVVTIIVNYAGLPPGAPSDWYLIGGILAIVVGLVLTTSYR